MRRSNMSNTVRLYSYVHSINVSVDITVLEKGEEQ